MLSHTAMKPPKKGEWRMGPGVELFKTVQEKLGNLSIIAEDLGFITDDVRRMLNELGYPGMKVMQFAFGEDSKKTNTFPIILKPLTA